MTLGPTTIIVMIFIRYDYSTSYPDGEAADKDEEVLCIHSLLLNKLFDPRLP